MAIDCIGQGSNDLDQAGPGTDVHANRPQTFPKLLAARRERNLGQQPEGADERRIVRRYREASLSGLRRGSCDGFELSPSGDQLDNLLPPLAGWQPK
jgi:hypothetical protein